MISKLTSSLIHFIGEIFAKTSNKYEGWPIVMIYKIKKYMKNVNRRLPPTAMICYFIVLMS